MTSLNDRLIHVAMYPDQLQVGQPCSGLAANSGQ